MPIIDTNTSRSISSLLRAQQTGFRDAVNKQGQLVRNPELTGLKARLVSLVQQGTVRSGSFGGRVIKVLVGRQNFERISRQLQTNADRSAKNVLTAFIQSETKGLDSNMKALVTDNIQRRLGNNRSRFSAREFASLHVAIKEKLIPERLAARHSLISTIEGGMPTSKMQTLSQSHLRIALEALSTGSSPAKVMNQHNRIAFREKINLDKVSNVTRELGLLEDTIKNSDEINKLHKQVRHLEGVAAPAPEAAEQLAELRTELAQLKEQASARAEALRGSYTDTLAGLYEEVSIGEDPLTLPVSQYEDDTAQGPGSGVVTQTRQDSIASSDASGTDTPPGHARERDANKSVSFEKAYTREDPATAGSDQTQLWEFAESRNMFTLEQVETALAQVDMESLNHTLLSRLGQKVSRNLNHIIVMQGKDPGVQARVQAAREHPLCNQEASHTNKRYHDLDDIKDMLTIMDVDVPNVSDKKLALEMYDTLLRADKEHFKSAEEKATIAELKQNPVFEKHVLDYIEERMSETTLRGRGRERALFVLQSVSGDTSASDLKRTRAQALLERLQASRPQEPE